MNPNLIIMKRGKFPFFSERKLERENFKLSFTKTYILTLIMIGILGIYYVWTLNVNATKGYTIRNLEIERRNLTFEKNLLNMKIAEVQSLNSISSDTSLTLMATVENPKFLVLKDSNLALLINKD
ncbi:hypothetical protein KAZ01_01875 [Candidatus Gracilibacteria bacterium]|nr:hypothetical protein [Candidatus Gracilibacteria bacterium]